MEPDEELELAHTLIAEKKLKIKYKNRLRKRLAEAERVSAAGDAGVAGSRMIWKSWQGFSRRKNSGEIR